MHFEWCLVQTGIAKCFRQSAQHKQLQLQIILHQIRMPWQDSDFQQQAAK